MTEKFVLVQLVAGSYAPTIRVFDNYEDARAAIWDSELKAWIITCNGPVEIEDHS